MTIASRAGIALIGLGFVLMTAPAAAQSVERITRMVDVDGVERTYLLLVPERLAAEPAPLVFNLHGSGGNPEGQVATSAFDRVAAEHGFLAVLPQGAYTNTRSSRSWNADLDPAGVDDVALVRAVIDDVAHDYPVDRTRIYAAGFSGGARMSSRLGCELAGVLAAVAPVAGIQFGAGCDPARPIPILTFHGKADRVNHFVPNADSAPYWVAGVEDSIARWREADGCSDSKRESQVSDTVTHLSWDNCRGGAVVEAYLIEDGGHTWPGSPRASSSERSGVTNKDIDASELIWQFFSRFELPQK